MFQLIEKQVESTSHLSAQDARLTLNLEGQEVERPPQTATYLNKKQVYPEMIPANPTTSQPDQHGFQRRQDYGIGGTTSYQHLTEKRKTGPSFWTPSLGHTRCSIISKT